MAVAPWVGTQAWTGSDPWDKAHSPSDRDAYLRSVLDGDGTTGAVLTGGTPLTAALASDGVTNATLDVPLLLTAVLTID